METPATHIESLIEKAEQYANTRYELSKLKSLEQTNALAASLITRGLVAINVLIFLMFMNVGIALILGSLLGGACYGFFIVAVFHLLVGVLYYFFLQRWIKRPLSNFIITQVLQ